VVIGENKTFMGEEEWLTSRGVLLEVLQDPECIKLMEDFYQGKAVALERGYRHLNPHETDGAPDSAGEVIRCSLRVGRFRCSGPIAGIRFSLIDLLEEKDTISLLPVSPALTRRGTGRKRGG
jgi:hypothetical protein